MGDGVCWLCFTVLQHLNDMCGIVTPTELVPRIEEVTELVPRIKEVTEHVPRIKEVSKLCYTIAKVFIYKKIFIT